MFSKKVKRYTVMATSPKGVIFVGGDFKEPKYRPATDADAMIVSGLHYVSDQNVAENLAREGGRNFTLIKIVEEN